MTELAPKRYYDKIHGYLLTASQALNNTRIRLIPFKHECLCTEIMICDRPKFNGQGYGLIGEVSKSVKRDFELDPLTPEEQADYISRSRRRALKAVRDIMDCNDFQYFMTFTLDPEKIERTDYTAFIKAVNQYLDNRVRRYGWKYCAVAEYHKRTESNGKRALHLHACVSGDKFNFVDSGTVIRPDSNKPVLRSTARKQGYKESDLKTVYNVSDWKYGYSTAIHTYGKRLALSRYITKYITKSEEKVGGRWYYSGGDLQRPQYLYDDSDFHTFIGDVEFAHEFGEFKIKYFDEGLTLDRLESILHCG